MQPRSWAVLVMFELCGSAVVRVRVDGVPLLPEGNVRSPLAALEYIDEARVDCRFGDEITLLAHQRARASLSTWSRVRALALHWRAEALQVAACERGLSIFAKKAAELRAVSRRVA